MRGFGLLEIVIAVAVISATIFSLSFVFIISSRLEEQSLNKTRANFLAEEGLEALRFLRDKSWSSNLANLTVGANYYLSFATTTSSWSMSSVSGGLVDNLFLRTVTLANVQRNASDDIVSSGGTNDPNTKQFNVSVAWSNRGATSTITISTYLSDVFAN